MAIAVLALNVCKKGRGLLLLPFLLFIFSCVKDLSRSGKVTLHDSSSKKKKYFVFTVSEEFIKENQGSDIDKNHPKMTEAEASLLEKLLKDKEYCLDGMNPSFDINSRQEKIYDMTFAHLIEENYNARPVAPRSYFGRCKEYTK